MSTSHYRKIWVVLFLAALCTHGQALAKPITLAYNSNALNIILPIVVAQELGFFAGEGLEVTAVYVRSGPTAMTALVSGSADYTSVGSTTVIQAIAKGVPALVIGNYIKQVNYVLMGAKGIANLNSLKGHVVGVTGAGGMTEFTTVESWPAKGCGAIATTKFNTRATVPCASAPWKRRSFKPRPFLPPSGSCSNKKVSR